MTPKGRSPGKTPKRKVAQCNLIWPQNTTREFLEECRNVNERLRSSYVPVIVWQNIAEKLIEGGHARITWELCRAKFEYLQKFYKDTLLKTGGVLGGVKWPYYDLFQEIVGVKEGNTVWNNAAVKVLLDLYSEKKYLLDEKGSCIRKTVVYDEIASAMNLFDIEVDGTACHNKMNALKDTFRNEFDNGARTGGVPSTWEFYDRMFEIFKDTPTCNAPIALSVGTSSLKYTVDGKLMEDMSRGTRTRPAVQVKGNRLNQRSLAQSLKERQLQQNESLAQEVRLWRQDSLKKSEERIELLRELVIQNRSNVPKN